MPIVPEPTRAQLDAEIAALKAQLSKLTDAHIAALEKAIDWAEEGSQVVYPGCEEDSRLWTEALDIVRAWRGK